MTEINKGHGRIERRTLTVCEARGIDWPGAEQVCKIERLVCHRAQDKLTAETVYAVTSLTAKQASASKLLKLNRGHWSIETTLHYVRDVTLREDASQVRKGNGPYTMPILRNAAIGILHNNGVSMIAAGLRKMATNIGAARAAAGIAWLLYWKTLGLYPPACPRSAADARTSLVMSPQR